MKLLTSLTTLVLLLLLSSCKSTELKPLPKSKLGYRCHDGHQGATLNLRHHVVQIDDGGVLVVNPRGASKQLLGTLRPKEAGTTAEYLDTMFAFLNKPGQRPHHVIVFVNGGLNSLRVSTNRATRILADDKGHVVLRQDTAFLFINWNSSLDSYLEHLITHQGVVVPRGVLGVGGRLFWGSLNLVADAGRMATSLPLLTAQYYTQPGVWRAGTLSTRKLYRLDLPNPEHLQFETSQVNQQAYNLNQALCIAPDQAMGIYLGNSKRRGSFVYHYAVPGAWQAPSVFFLPIVPWTNIAPVLGVPWGWGFTNPRLATLIAADFVARPAWNSMLRRTQVMFVKPKPVVQIEKGQVQQQEQRAKFRSEGREKTSKLQMELGVVPQFVQRLSEYQQGRLKADGRPVTVTLMGHSMGTIVVSEILRDELQRPDSLRLDCDAVVFLAAACPLRDVRTKVVPYLVDNKNTRFYNLTLHPYAELTENMTAFAGRPILDGSLLVYIDRLLTNPLTPQERTAGRWHNFVLATADTTFIPASVRNRVTLKAFGAGNRVEDGPQAHTDFGTPFLQEKTRNAQGKRVLKRHKDFFWSHEFRNLPQVPCQPVAP